MSRNALCRIMVPMRATARLSRRARQHAPQGSGHAETTEIHPDNSGAADAVGNAQAHRSVFPGTPAHSAQRAIAGTPFAPVHRRTIVVAVPAVVRPFPRVA